MAIKQKNSKELTVERCLDDPVVLALAVLMDRIRVLPKADKDDLYELFNDFRQATTNEERREINAAMREILTQAPAQMTDMPINISAAMPDGLKKWAEHVGRTIRELRTKAGLTQTQLAEKAGLPQSHISRLEKAEHSATHKTLAKIAKALGVTVGEIDPCLPLE